MAERYELTEEERRAVAELAELRKAKGKVPIAASFRDRMTSATVDPSAPIEPAKPAQDDQDEPLIFRP